MTPAEYLEQKIVSGETFTFGEYKKNFPNDSITEAEFPAMIAKFHDGKFMSRRVWDGLDHKKQGEFLTNGGKLYNSEPLEKSKEIIKGPRGTITRGEFDQMTPEEATAFFKR